MFLMCISLHVNIWELKFDTSVHVWLEICFDIKSTLAQEEFVWVTFTFTEVIFQHDVFLD